MPGDCHYLAGNAHARRRISALQNLITQIGLQPERVRMVNLSSAMAEAFARLADEMTQQVLELGPSPLKQNP